MARAPQQRAPQASDGDDFYGEEDHYDGADGTDDFGGGRGEGGDESAGASEYPRESDPELEEEGDLGFEDEDPPPLRRGEGRVQRLANEARELRRQLEEARRSPPQPQQPTGPRPETDQEFANRISLLSAEEQLNAKFDRFAQQQAVQNQRTQFDIANQRDRDEFRAFCRTDKRAARMADEVEREFDKSVRAGNPAPRMNILKFLAGTRLFEGDSQDTKRARDGARQRVERQTVRPASAGSDVARPSRRERTDEKTARAKRLDGVQI